MKLQILNLSLQSARNCIKFVPKFTKNVLAAEAPPQTPLWSSNVITAIIGAKALLQTPPGLCP